MEKVANYAVPLRRLFCQEKAAQPTPYRHICCSTKYASNTRNMRVGSGWRAAPGSPARRNGNGVCACARDIGRHGPRFTRGRARVAERLPRPFEAPPRSWGGCRVGDSMRNFSILMQNHQVLVSPLEIIFITLNSPRPNRNSLFILTFSSPTNSPPPQARALPQIAYIYIYIYIHNKSGPIVMSVFHHSHLCDYSLPQLRLLQKTLFLYYIIMKNSKY